MDLRADLERLRPRPRVAQPGYQPNPWDRVAALHTRLLLPFLLSGLGGWIITRNSDWMTGFFWVTYLGLLPVAWAIDAFRHRER